MKQSMQLWIASGAYFCCLATTGQTQAQVIPDATLPNNSSVTPQGNTSIITGGTVAGRNLFHSFEQFSVPAGSAAYFDNTLEIHNIISRVTGSSSSNINGLIRTNGTANLFLLNPNGIIFGPNASLKIEGSFLASTASSLRFADGTEFSATAPQAAPLLTVNVPVGLQFGGNIGRIEVGVNGQGITRGPNDTNAGLRVLPNQTLALVGGDVVLKGGKLKTAGGRIELGSVAGPGLVSLTPIDKGWALGYSGVPTFGDIQLSQRAAVSATGPGGGDVQVRGRQVTFTTGSYIDASTQGAEPGGTLSVTAKELVELIGSSSGLSTVVSSEATGAGGHLTVETGRLIVRDGAYILAGTFGKGPGGTLEVKASESVELFNTADSPLPSVLSTSAQSGATGAGGKLTIETGRLIARDGAQIKAGTFGEGSAVTLAVEARESVELSGTSARGVPSGLFTQTDGAGAGGNLTLKTRRLIVQDGAQVSAATVGKGAGGTLEVRASEAVELSGTSAHGVPSRLTALTSGAADAGDLRIETGQLTVRDTAEVSVSSKGSGKAGTLEVQAGNILLELGKLNAETTSGNGGDITLQVQDLLLMRRNSQISATAGTEKTGGDGGNITINTRFIVAIPSENNDITANAFNGNGGKVQITAQGIFGLTPRSQQELKTLLETDNPSELDPRELPSNDITAISQTNPSLSGQVTLNTPDVDPSLGLVALPVGLVDASGLIASSCGASGENKFVVTGRGGLPPNPKNPLNSNTVWVDWVTLNPGVENSSSPAISTNLTAPESASIVEARGWAINGKGEVVLTANAPTTTPHSPWKTFSDCHTPEASSWNSSG